jgi:hypothetical protein
MASVLGTEDSLSLTLSLHSLCLFKNVFTKITVLKMEVKFI